MLYALIKTKLIYTAFLAAICCTLCIFSMTYLSQLKVEKDEQHQMMIQTDTMISSMYELYGNWEEVIAKLQSSKIMRDRDLQIWSSSNQLIWPQSNPIFDTNGNNISNASIRKVVLVNGQKVGTFVVSSESKIRDVSRIWMSSGLIGVFIFVILASVLFAKEKAHRRSLRNVLTHLSFLELQENERRLFSLSEIEQAAISQISKLGQKLYRLETIRKSMVADIAHELRTPLTIMRAQLDNSFYSQSPIELSQAILLQDEVFRMSKLLGDLQQLALAESGHLLVNKTWFSLRKCMEELIIILDSDADDSRIKLIFHNEKDVYRVYADEDRIRQVFVNLIGNALRHAYSIVKITVAFDSSFCVVTVYNDGVGIEEEELPYVFERFYRGQENRQKEKLGSQLGLGLGLSIVKQFIEIHHGTIDVTSRWQEGTTFHIKFPIFIE